MGKIYCIMGKSASGKDTMYKKLMADKELGLRKMVIYTTRPKRAGEIDGETYYFTDEEGYRRFEAEGKVIESRLYDTVYGPWRYFTADDGRSDPAKGDHLVIVTPEAYEKLRDYYGRDTVVPLYLVLDDGERLQRALDRERKQKEPGYREMCRRYLADDADFAPEKLQALGIEDGIDNTDKEEGFLAIKHMILGADAREA
ncbi:MAG: guanylate kinase [Lachnospiraceae bacterium]|nr:guanylate kinase [Lachnospiraceae bacterium]